MIKPIQTFYNGYRFRSRTEARWAVFFDALKIKYEYEPEGYVLPQHGPYLVDFYFPEGLFTCGNPIFAEVKPYQGEYPNISELFPILDEFVKKIGSLILLDGPPDFTYYHIGNYGTLDFSDKDRVSWGDCAMLWGDAICENRWFWYGGFEERHDRDLFDKDNFEKRYIDAVYAARTARFEHGEKPIL